MNLLVLSNGAGEDAIAASIVNHLRPLRPDLPVTAFPLVGAGAAYPADLPRLGDLKAPPSQGLSNQSWRLWWRDVRHGLMGRVLDQWLNLRSQRAHTGAVLAVGDLVPCLLAGLAGMAPIYFVGTAKSVYHHAYSWPERLLLRTWVAHSLVRDQPTAEALQQGGVAASYLGNAMMDDAVPAGLDLGLTGPVLALFPGSRAQAPEELGRLLDIWQQVHREFPCQAAVAVAEGLPLESLALPGWRLEPLSAEIGVVGRLHCANGAAVVLVRRALGDVLAASQLALGQAGTAHEQAVGAGVPVVSLHPHPQGPLGWYRGRQKGLLGESLLLVAQPQEAAATLLRLFRDPLERERRAAIGRQRMGEPGGARKMAHWLAERL
jgi:uncharacterized protein (TIGR03492 family)